MCEIHRIKCGNGNCYIVENGTGGILVDTAKKEHKERVLEECRKYNIKLIVLTHAHFDHAENAVFLSNALDVPIAMNENDLDLIDNNANQSLFAETVLGKIVLSVSLKNFSRRVFPKFKPDIFLKEGDKLSEYGVNAEIVELPGHTNGSIGVNVDGKALIVGDALMNMFYPTVSMLYHDKKAMLESAEKISRCNAETIYFGHGSPKPNRKWVKHTGVEYGS